MAKIDCWIDQQTNVALLYFFLWNLLNVPILDNGTLNAAGLLTHSAKDFWKRRTCNGFDAIPTKAIISKNSSSPASHNCWTSSPPEKIKIYYFKYFQFILFL